MKILFKIFLTTMLLGNFSKEIFATDIKKIDITNNTSQKEENITLEGMIGPYDPNDLQAGDPDFNGISSDDLEGDLPDNYYTISVTVPTNMNFAVVSGFGRGQFYSPKYTIENKATRPVYISVKSLVEDSFVENDEFNKLYLRKPTHYDDNIEIDLYLSMLNNNTSEMRKVQLSENFDVTQTHCLGVLGLKESGVLQFESTDWDVPGLDAPDKHAKNDFTVQLEFSLEDPNQTTQP